MSKKQPFFVRRLSILFVFREPQKFRHPARKKNFCRELATGPPICGLKRVRLLEVSKVLPGCGTILPLAAYLPTNGTVFYVGPSVWLDNVLVKRSNHSVKSSMVND